MLKYTLLSFLLEFTVLQVLYKSTDSNTLLLYYDSFTCVYSLCDSMLSEINYKHKNNKHTYQPPPPTKNIAKQHTHKEKGKRQNESLSKLLPALGTRRQL